jgi:uncharacterized protein
MLIRLFGSNFRSLKQPFDLNLVAADLTRKDDRHRGVIPSEVPWTDGPLTLLRTVAIFGANGSGKSTVLMAAKTLHWLATLSSSTARPDQRIAAYEPFLLDDQTKTAPIRLGCDVTFRKSILRYEIAFSEFAILEERLSLVNPKGETKLIDRGPNGPVKGKLISQSIVNSLYVQEMQPNVSVLSKLAQHGPAKGKESAREYFHAIRDSLLHRDYAYTLFAMSSHSVRFADDPTFREWIMKSLIRESDVGISDVLTRKEKFEISPALFEEMKHELPEFALPEHKIVVQFLHDGLSRCAIPFSDESHGTQKLFGLGGDWWKLAHEPVTMFLDELGAGLHPRLLDQMIRSLNGMSSDRVQSQLVFTTHDPGLMEGSDGSPPVLRRDQVYFTKKDSDGATELYSLTEFKDEARPVHNLRKRYLTGRYGAIPLVDSLSL